MVLQIHNQGVIIMIKMVISLLLVFGFSMVWDSSNFGIISHADESEQVSDTAQKSRGSGSNDNIKSKSDKNDPNAEIPAPANKTDDKSRQGVCCITVDNYTSWKIQVFVDGDLHGLLFPWGEGTSCVYSGATSVYARAEFNNGTYSDWGPRIFNCRPGRDYTWDLKN